MHNKRLKVIKKERLPFFLYPKIPQKQKNRRAKPPKPPRKFKILSFRGVFLKKFRFFIDYYVIIIRNVDF
ncbi:hypothetical protein HPHPH21_0695 [Helicobacter pylori Hp H-21]|nr:hypothetical protein HPHPH21_0695 [Helicobacter pylori Hp H-21]